MLENFHLVAIVRQNEQLHLRRFSLEESLQNTLAGDWEDQYKTVIEQQEEKEFTIAYTLRRSEHFRICPYKLPEWLAGNNSENIRTICEANENLYGSIKGIVAFARDDENNEIMLFQNFTRNQVIQPGRAIFRKNNTYEGMEEKAVRLDYKLMAVYFPKNKTLLFRNAHSVNKFLPLPDASDEASNKDIRGLLNHGLFECENMEKFVTNATPFMRTEFAILKNSGILDRLTKKFGPQAADFVSAIAAEHDIKVRVQEDKIVLPTEKDDATEIVQFLNQEIFRGPLTNELFETNSKQLHKNVR